MLSNQERILHALLALIVLSSGLASEAFAQGFGSFGKKSIILQRTMPAFVNLNAKRIRIDAETSPGVPPQLAEILKTKFVTEIQSDTSFIVEPVNPETILRFTITNFSVTRANGYRQMGNQNQPYTTLRGDLQISYQALDAKGRAPIDSENLVAGYNREFGPGAIATADKKSGGGVKGALTGIWNNQKAAQQPVPSDNELMGILIDDVVMLMARRAVATQESVEAALPGGAFKDQRTLAEQGRWGELQRNAEMMDPLPKPDDDSYRHYLIGLAFEAQAYAAGDEKSTSSLLAQARQAYQKASQLKPDEKYYSEPENRIRVAILQYDQLRMSRETAGQQVVQAPKAAKVSDKLDNAAVMAMCEKQLDKNLILTMVQSGPNPQFEVNPQTMIELASSGVPTEIIQAMMQRMADAANKKGSR